MASENTQTVGGFIPDPCQQEVIEAQGGFHLVLAPPGCGKTQILTERIRYAHDSEGVEYKDMLCLTFTNRAARGMIERITQNIADDDVRDVLVRTNIWYNPTTNVVARIARYSILRV